MIVSAVLGVLLAIGAKSSSLRTRVGLALIPVMAVLIGWDWFRSLVTEPVLTVPYSECRLTPTLALARGYSPYPPFDHGPLIGCFYPPIEVLAFLPATVFSNPTAAVLAGRCLSVFFSFAPLIWILALEVRHGRLKTLNAAVLFIVFAVVANHLICLRYSTTEIHADAPAIALGCIALGFVGLIRGPEMNWAWYGAIIASILAAWTKQVQVFLLLVPIFRAFTSFGVRTGFKVLAITLVMAVVIAGLLLLMFGFRDCLFYLLVLRLQPFQGATAFENLRILGWVLGVQIQRPLLVFLALLLTLLTLDRFRLSAPPEATRKYPTWLPFLLGGIVEIPVSFSGCIKVGGDFNQLSFAIYPTLFALILIMGRLVDSRPRREFLLMLLVLYLGVSEYRFISRHLQNFDYDQSGHVLTWIDEQRLIVRYLQTHKDEVYFPFNTFEHLAIDHRLYHFAEPVLNLETEGFRTSDRNLKDHTPQNLNAICYPPSFKEHDALLKFCNRFMVEFFPEFQTPVTIPELPGFLCFTRRPSLPEAKVGREDSAK
jgi:hypothetical protein